ncbi:radical SAM protein [Methylobacterium aquaticum]|uniref:radical SAM protein n=1 Tax=Methylobacterium aquaticum TaxID=270351 RepID=UPI001933CAC0|nr:radical SAM protein [Methylobacterium aquaticum]QRE75210.1 radical SAM protein [Methylobacterium aquaticum]
MDCRILRQLTLKADGHLSCDDSNGYYIHVGDVANKPGWSIKQVFGGAIYEHIRRSFQDGRVPWPGKCETCDCFSPHDRPSDTLESRVRIMVEPTLDCRLACPSCKRRQELGRRRSDDHLAPGLLGSLVRSCVRSGIAVDEVHYLGWGEPLLHPDFRELVETVRALSPGTIQEVTTTGNADFRASLGDTYIDRVVVSCDGVRQDEYRKYRINGSLEEALRFMREAKLHGHPDTFVEWKYILFDGNDHPDDLIQAQALAEEFGLDSLLFIVTNSKTRSLRYTNDTIAEIPIRWRRTRVSPAAAMMIGSRISGHVDPARSQLGDKDNASLYIDECRVTRGNMLTVSGWSLGADGSYVDEVELTAGLHRQVTQTGDLRHDVAAARSNAQGARCGFLFRVPLGEGPMPDALALTVKVRNHTQDFSAAVNWPAAG